jgi:hypothetical protein
LKGKKLGFSSVYSTICANFLGKNHQIFWYDKIEKKGTYLQLVPLNCVFELLF